MDGTLVSCGCLNTQNDISGPKLPYGRGAELCNRASTRTRRASTRASAIEAERFQIVICPSLHTCVARSDAPSHPHLNNSEVHFGTLYLLNLLLITSNIFSGGRKVFPVRDYSESGGGDKDFRFKLIEGTEDKQPRHGNTRQFPCA